MLLYNMLLDVAKDTEYVNTCFSLELLEPLSAKDSCNLCVNTDGMGTLMEFQARRVTYVNILISTLSAVCIRESVFHCLPTYLVLSFISYGRLIKVIQYKEMIKLTGFPLSPWKIHTIFNFQLKAIAS